MKTKLFLLAASALFVLSLTSCNDDNGSYNPDPWHCLATPWYDAFYCTSTDGEWALGYAFLNHDRFSAVRIALASFPDKYVQLNALVPVKIVQFREVDNGYKELKVEALTGEDLENGWTINACTDVYRGKFVIGENQEVQVQLTEIPASDEYFKTHTDLCFHAKDYPGIESLKSNLISFKIVKYIWAKDMPEDATPVCVIVPAES